MANAVIMVIAIIVEEWPDGKEWKDDSVEKKLNSKPPQAPVSTHSSPKEPPEIK